MVCAAIANHHRETSRLRQNAALPSLASTNAAFTAGRLLTSSQSHLSFPSMNAAFEAGNASFGVTSQLICFEPLALALEAISIATPADSITLPHSTPRGPPTPPLKSTRAHLPAPQLKPQEGRNRPWVSIGSAARRVG